MKQCTLRYAIVEVLVEIHQLLEIVALRSIVIFVIVQGQMAFTSLNDPHVRRQHSLCNYAILVSTNGNYEVRTSVGAPPPNSSTSVPLIHSQITTFDVHST